MAIKVGSSDISDIQLNVNGTLMPVNAVRIGGSATNLWERGGRTGPWNSGKWVGTSPNGRPIEMEWEGRYFIGYDGREDFYLYYYDSESKWNLEGIRFYQSESPKTAISLTFNGHEISWTNE